MVLVDTSVWVDFLRGIKDPKVFSLKELLVKGEVSLNEVIFAEICFGARGPKQFEQFKKYFSSLPFLHLPEDWHHTLAEMGQTLTRSGYKPFIADLLITLTALDHQVPLLTTDSDFEIFEKLFGLKLI